MWAFPTLQCKLSISRMYMCQQIIKNDKTTLSFIKCEEGSVFVVYGGLCLQGGFGGVWAGICDGGCMLSKLHPAFTFHGRQNKNIPKTQVKAFTLSEDMKSMGKLGALEHP